MRACVALSVWGDDLSFLVSSCNNPLITCRFFTAQKKNIFASVVSGGISYDQWFTGWPGGEVDFKHGCVRVKLLIHKRYSSLYVASD